LLDRVSGRRKVELSPRRNPELSADLRLRTRLVQKALFLRIAGGDLQERLLDFLGVVKTNHDRLHA
jgi:hypothetical protein